MTPTDVLSIHHLRKTPTRLDIIQSLQSSNKPLSESEMHERMANPHDRITMYRTLLTLLDAGIIHRIVADNTTICYALNNCSVDRHQHTSEHVHFFCKKCETVECLKALTLTPYSLPIGYTEEEYNVVIKGICRKCAETKKG